MVARQVRRVSKMEAVNILDVSLSTVERMIKRGELQVGKRGPRRQTSDMDPPGGV